MLLRKYLPIILALVYVVNPFDLVPDFLLGLGWIDDISLVALAYWWMSRFNKKSASQKKGTWQQYKRYAGSGSGSGSGSSSSSSSSGKSGTGQGSSSSSSSSSSSTTDPYKILGIAPGAAKKEIREAYTRLAAQYHPDKVQHLGPELQELAHKKFIEIQKAYDSLK